MRCNYFKKNLIALDFARSMVPVLQEAANPLFLNTPIKNFSYLKFFSDGSVINLSTDIKWIEYRFEENIKYKILFESQLKKDELEKPYMYFWPNQVDGHLLGALHAFGIWNGCNIYIPRREEIEVFSFASTNGNQDLNNFYVNNFNFLSKYIIYFKSHIDAVLEQNERNSKIQTDIIFPAIASDDEINILNQPDDAFYWGLKKITISDGVDLTYKEIQCCYYLSHGLSMKAIAKELLLSPRTVETHINHIKLKTNCTTKDTLIGYINQRKWIFDALLTKTL